MTDLDFGLIVTENPREIARERLLRRPPTTSFGKVARRFLIDVPIGNTKNAKTLQVNKLYICHGVFSEIQTHQS